MRIDGDVAHKPTYVSVLMSRLSPSIDPTLTHFRGRPAQQFPNSYQSTNPASRAPTFPGKSLAEAPWQAASNVVSRDSHWSHEGEPSEYDQVRELYTRVMNEEQRANLHKNTAKLLQVSGNILSSFSLDHRTS
jgi:catalase